MGKIREMEKLHEEELKLYTRKTLDYGSVPIEITGTVGLLVHIADKIHRVLNLKGDGMSIKVTDENLRDTLIDISNYANMAIIEMEK